MIECLEILKQWKYGRFTNRPYGPLRRNEKAPLDDEAFRF